MYSVGFLLSAGPNFVLSCEWGHAAHFQNLTLCILTQVIPFGSPGYRLNCVSVLFAVFAAYFHFGAVLRWHLGLVKRGSAHCDDTDVVWRGSVREKSCAELF